MLVRIEPMSSLIHTPELLKRRCRGPTPSAPAQGCGFVDDAPRAPASCRGQRDYALPTAPAFAHKLHGLPPPSMTEPQRLRPYRGDNYCDAGGSRPASNAAATLMQTALGVTIHGGWPSERWFGCFVNNHPIDPWSATSICLQALTRVAGCQTAKVSSILLRRSNKNEAGN